MNTTNGKPLLDQKDVTKFVDSQKERPQSIDVFENPKGHIFYVTKAFPANDQVKPKLSILISDDHLSPLPHSNVSIDLPNNEPLSADIINNDFDIWTSHFYESDNALWERILQTS